MVESVFLAECTRTVLEVAEKVAGPLGERVYPWLYVSPPSLRPTANPSPTQNLAVFREICKYVYRSETSPNTATVRSTYQTMWARAINREFWSLAVRSGEIARITVYALEAYGIFKVCIRHTTTSSFLRPPLPLPSFV
ncbi:hypothetical protein D9758_018676 [Tetrapyrgos nigripes]|uniref:Uncharacterized protein n=1 Tax=Tetrapyrgos nigripes TaxID=182062 RepID=A0A8H5EZS1_9AGAR|nr:hypothetical protein D9758_018676 [Tetrapyrgos nigripes]